MFEQMLNKIRAKTREDWLVFLKEQAVAVRIWTQEHAELAAGIAFLLGIAIMLFGKLFGSILFLAAVVLVVLLLIAPSEESNKSAAAPENRTDGKPAAKRSRTKANGAGDPGSPDIDA